MRREARDRILMSLLGICFFLNIVIMNVSVAPIRGLVIAGWVALGIGVLLFTLAFLTLHREGTASVVESGVYGVVRHPMYVGATVMFLSHILFSGNWIVRISTIVALICCYLIIRSADERNVEKFGDEYRRYMKRVPRMNLLRGVIRSVRRRKKEQ